MRAVPLCDNVADAPIPGSRCTHVSVGGVKVDVEEAFATAACIVLLTDLIFVVIGGYDPSHQRTGKHISINAKKMRISLLTALEIGMPHPPRAIMSK
jgi:hypothetical protein